MATESTRPLGQQSLDDGSVTASTRLTPVADRVRGSMVVPPTTVVPIIFVPGIMGSNLRDKHTGESVWNTNSTVSILLQWIFRSARTRQSKLRAEDAEVDPTGRWYGRSATIPNRDAAAKRGEGTTSRAFYGDFVRWLDDRLNQYGNVTGNGVPSPWDPMVNQGVGAWNPEKTPEALTRHNADFAWGNFFCPVHVQGYNWLQSNGTSGTDLANKIDDVIAQWNGRQGGIGPTFQCKQVILVSHSMGGLVTRAAVHPKFGNAADKVLGIIHGELPANGAAATYHHCRSGYGGISGWVLGRNAAQVTAVVANSPGALELLPNQQYPKRWLKARVGHNAAAVMTLPETDPYVEIYFKKATWWRLVDPALIDPNGRIDKPWMNYGTNLKITKDFHKHLATTYDQLTYVHYGADHENHPAFGDLVWHDDSGHFPTHSERSTRADYNGSAGKGELLAARPFHGSNPVSVQLDGRTLRFSIVDPGDTGYRQPGDGTVPSCSGEAPNTQGGGNVKQSFRLTGFEHQDAYDDDQVRHATLYSICMLLQEAEVL